MLLVCRQAEPGQIVSYPLRMVLAGTLAVGVVEAKDEASAILARPQPIVDRGADIADMEPAGRRRREAGDDGQAGRLGPRRRANKPVKSGSVRSLPPSLASHPSVSG